MGHRQHQRQILGLSLATFAVMLALASCQSSVRFSASAPSDSNAGSNRAVSSTPASQAENRAARGGTSKTPSTSSTPQQIIRPRPARPLAPYQETMLDVAYSWLNVPYRYGAADRSGTDCSGFTMRVYEEIGVRLPRSSRQQYEQGRFIHLEQLEAGDLLFFNTDGTGVSHVGLYVGEGTMIHASSRAGVITQRLSDAYYSKTFVAAKRLL